MEIMNQAVLTGKIKKQSHKGKLIAALLVLFGVGAAFYFSAMPREVSAAQSRIIMNMINSTFNLELTNHIIRKIAHFVLFGGIGAVMTFALSFKLQGTKLFTYSFSLTALMAIIDETHQMFVPGRGPSVKDVMIDSAGALIAVLLFGTIITMIQRRKTSRNQYTA